MNDAIQRGWSERTVTVNRTELLKTLEANREKHRAAYLEAVAGYRVMATEKLDKLRTRALRQLADNFCLVQGKIDKFDPTDEDALGSTVVLLQGLSFTLAVPEDHTKSYDVAIEMARWEVGDTITLTQGQFQCFVLDDWEWQRQFQHLNKTYVGALRKNG